MIPEQVLADTVRGEWGRLIALLLRQFRRLDLAEDALADAVESATRTWPDAGAPDRPAAWLLTAARRRVIDRLRAEAMAARRAPLVVADEQSRRGGGGAMADPGDLVEDDVLRLVLMCCHPSLPPEVASALALRLVVGTSTADIARLFLVPEPTMAARITRGKKKIVAAGIPFAVPDATALPSRLSVVAHTAYLAFTAGYAPGSGDGLVRSDLAGDAIRLVRVTIGLRPDEPVLLCLLALMLLQHSRRDARVDGAGALVLLPDQDRSSWHHEEIEEALDLLRRLPPDPEPLAESYRLQALVAAEHAIAPTAADTRWDRICDGYAALLAVNPTPAARLALAVAVSERDGPEAGLRALAGLEREIPTSHRVPAVRADLLVRAGRSAEATKAYERAIAMCGNAVEREHLTSRRDEIAGH